MVELISGEFGGAMALAFGFGAAAGYGFAMKTATNEARSRIQKLEVKIDSLQQKYEESLMHRPTIK